jgi:acyl-CoA hydrolase
MSLDERINNAETHQYRMVFPCSLNDNGMLFGGTAIQWMDEVAYIAAQRFTRTRMITVTLGNVNFRKSIGVGSIIEIIGRIIKVGRIKIDVSVEIYKENLEDNKREKAVDAIFTFVAINKENKPISINLT